MSLNFLKLNESKTEFIIVGVQQQLDKIRKLSIKVGDDIITNVSVVRNVGVHIDSELKLSTHVNRIVSSSFDTLQNISRTWQHFDCDSTKTLVQVLIISRLDYWNSLFLGIPQYNVDKLQWIQNMSCRVIKWLPKSSQITDYPAELHWLKIQDHIMYKVSILMFKCLHNLAPQYLIDITIFTYHQELNLRSRNKCMLPTKLSRTSLCTLDQYHPWDLESGTCCQWQSRIQTILKHSKLYSKHTCLLYHIIKLSIKIVNLHKINLLYLGATRKQSHLPKA